MDIDLDKDVALRQGASASIESLGLLGDKYVELVPGPVGAPAAARGNDDHRGTCPVSFDQITKLARDIEVDIKDDHEEPEGLARRRGRARSGSRTIVENIRVITEELRAIVEANRGNVDATMANFREFSDGDDGARRPRGHSSSPPTRAT